MVSFTFNAAAVLGALCLASAQESESRTLALSEDVTFNFDILSSFGQIHNEGADVSPILAAAKKIIPGDRESFTLTWFDLANETKMRALDPEIGYSDVQLRATWFSAANYFRRADTYNRGDWNDPRINAYWDEQQEAFDKAIAALPFEARRVQIPANSFTIEGIWCTQNSSERRPTILMGQGFDAAQEDLYHTFGGPALARGYNVLTFEGPGQPKVRRDQDAGFFPEWERVVTPVVDYALSELADYVDPGQMILYGHSMGGYLEARAAAFEKRTTALILNGGVWDLFEVFTGGMPEDLVELLESGKKEEFDTVVHQLLRDPDTPTELKWGVEQGCWAFKIESPFDFLQETRKYTLKGLTDRIQVPVWLADGEFEGANRGQSQKVKDALGDRAELHMFTGSAGYHCQTGAAQEFNRVVFAWLNKILNKA